MLKDVKVSKEFEPIFQKAQEYVSDYFKEKKESPSKGPIEIFGQRYILVRAASMSVEFFEMTRSLYREKSNEEALSVAMNFLFDIAHAIGIADARNFHAKMNVTDPIEKLSAGPVHFAYSGWAFVDIFPESKPSPDENYYLIYDHPYSFEAHSWIQSGKKPDFPVCVMNAGYSSGWCEESFGITLVASEILCTAKGDDHCRFIMAPPHKIEGHINRYLQKEPGLARKVTRYEIPGFFSRKKMEDKLRASLKEKEVLLKEIHHRVKNNMQIISSMLRLQSRYISDRVGAAGADIFEDSINRIKTMSLIHEKLYRSGDMANIDFHDYVRSLATGLYRSYGVATDGIELGIDVEDLSLAIDTAIPCGLIVNELLSNALKYAFPSDLAQGRERKITISLRKLKAEGKVEGHPYELIVSDNGIGIPKGLDLKKTGTLGLELVRTLAENQLRGEIELNRVGGTESRIRFKA